MINDLTTAIEGLLQSPFIIFLLWLVPTVMVAVHYIEKENNR